MSSTDAASWIRDEHKITSELMDRLQVHLGAIPEQQDRAWVDGLRHHFGRFRAHMKSQMRAEEDGGFLQPVTEQRPTLAPEVQRLCDEHRGIADRLDKLCDELMSVDAADRTAALAFSERVAEVLKVVRQHLEREHLLVHTAFNQDIGGNE